MSEGFSKWQAITLQAVTAIAAFMGTCFGLVVTQGGHGKEDALMPFTAGGFVYLACCNILSDHPPTQDQTTHQQIKITIITTTLLP